MKKRLFIILIVIGLILSLTMGTALAKKDGNNGNGNGNGQSEVKEDKKVSDNSSDESAAKNNGKGKKTDGSTDTLPKGKEKQALKNAFKQAVSPYLAKIKANKRAWGQAGGLGKLEGITADIESALQKLLDGQIPVTDEQLAAIKAEINKIKAYKAALKTDKSAQNAAWESYIRAKKTYSTDAAITALQKVIDLQLQRIEARKGIFASMGNILAIIKQALENPPVPAPQPSPSASPTESAEPSASPDVSSTVSAA